MTDEQAEAIGRIKAWRNDMRHKLHASFAHDIDAVIAMAEQNTKCVETVLLSEEFLKKLAAAFVNTPLPSTITSGESNLIPSSYFVYPLAEARAS